MKVTPLGLRVFVETDKMEVENQSGILLPNKGRNYLTGKVVSFGTVCMPFSIGDTLIFLENAGIDVWDRGASFKVLEYSDILGIVTK